MNEDNLNKDAERETDDSSTETTSSKIYQFVDISESKKIMFIVINILTVLIIAMLIILSIGKRTTSERKTIKNIPGEMYEVFNTRSDVKDPYLNLRDGPSTNNNILHKLNDGETVIVLEKGLGDNQSWHKIYYKKRDIYGYVHSRYLKKK